MRSWRKVPDRLRQPDRGWSWQRYERSTLIGDVPLYRFRTPHCSCSTRSNLAYRSGHTSRKFRPVAACAVPAFEGAFDARGTGERPFLVPEQRAPPIPRGGAQL
jgi:hypothetical protein